MEDAYYSLYRVIERPNGIPANRWGCVREFLNPIVDDSMMAVENPGAEITGPSELTIRHAGGKGRFRRPASSADLVEFMPDTYAKVIDEEDGPDTATSNSKEERWSERVHSRSLKARWRNFWRAERHDQLFPRRPTVSGRL